MDEPFKIDTGTKGIQTVLLQEKIPKELGLYTNLNLEIEFNTLYHINLNEDATHYIISFDTLYPKGYKIIGKEYELTTPAGRIQRLIKIRVPPNANQFVKR